MSKHSMRLKEKAFVVKQWEKVSYPTGQYMYFYSMMEKKFVLFLFNSNGKPIHFATRGTKDQMMELLKEISKEKVPQNA